MTPVVPFDFFTNGPLIGIIGLLLWYILRQQDRHDQQMAAKDTALLALQEKRIEDQKVLIPLGHSMVAATETSNEIVRRSLEK